MGGSYNRRFHFCEVFMRIARVVLGFLLLSSLVSFSQSSPSSESASKVAEGFSIDNIDKTVDPCTDDDVRSGGRQTHQHRRGGNSMSIS